MAARATARPRRTCSPGRATSRAPSTRSPRRPPASCKDDAGCPIFAADLHQGWRFRGGGSGADIYRRLRTGLDGTPMPSFSDLIDQKFLTDEQLWRLAQYVRSLSPPEPPEVRDVIHAPQIAGTVPVSPDDSVWRRVSRYWFPLVGQVIRKARWFAPAVPQRRRPGPRDRAVRHPAWGAGGAGELRSRRVAAGVHARPCHARYRQRSSA